MTFDLLSHKSSPSEQVFFWYVVHLYLCFHSKQKSIKRDHNIWGFSIYLSSLFLAKPMLAQQPRRITTDTPTTIFGAPPVAVASATLPLIRFTPIANFWKASSSILAFLFDSSIPLKKHRIWWNFPLQTQISITLGGLLWTPVLNKLFGQILNGNIVVL